MRRCGYAACCFTDASGIRVTDSRYNGPANTGRTRSAARTVPKGREGRRDKRKESSYASRDADTATVRETRTVRRTRRERRPPRASQDRFLAVACTIRAESRCGTRRRKRKHGLSVRRNDDGRVGGKTMASSFDDARMSAERIGNVKMKEGARSGKQACAYVFADIYVREGKRIKDR